MWHGLAQAVPGRRLTDISHAVEQAARAAGQYGIIREYTGHGIGSQMHMDPVVPNYGRAGRGPVLTAGMALAIEPMLALGSSRTRLLDDGWTVVTADGSRAAHFEHTVAVTDDGPWVLTARGRRRGRIRRLRARPGRTRPDGTGHGRPDRPDRTAVHVGLGRKSQPWLPRRREQRPMAYDPNIRASDADRDRTASLLREHLTAGPADAGGVQRAAGQGVRRQDRGRDRRPAEGPAQHRSVPAAGCRPDPHAPPAAAARRRPGVWPPFRGLAVGLGRLVHRRPGLLRRLGPGRRQATCGRCGSPARGAPCWRAAG